MLQMCLLATTEQKCFFLNISVFHVSYLYFFLNQIMTCYGLLYIVRHWLRLHGLGNNNEKLGSPERLSAGIQFRLKNPFHGKISGNRNFIC